MRILILIFAASLAVAADPTPVTKASLEARLKDLQTRREQMLANVNAMNGAIEDCQFWLEQLALAEKQAKPTPPTSAKAEPTIEHVVAHKEK